MMIEDNIFLLIIK